MGEAGNSGLEMTLERIGMYRGAAFGQLDIHTFSLNGEVQKECCTATGDPINGAVLETMQRGFDESGAPVMLSYDGVMPPEDCAQLADQLEALLI